MKASQVNIGYYETWEDVQAAIERGGEASSPPPVTNQIMAKVEE